MSHIRNSVALSACQPAIILTERERKSERERDKAWLRIMRLSLSTARLLWSELMMCCAAEIERHRKFALWRECVVLLVQ